MSSKREDSSMNQSMTVERQAWVVATRQTENPAYDTPSDEIAIAALQRLRACPQWQLRRLHCEWHAGILSIQGQVSSFYLKQLAQETVRSLADVARIVNHVVERISKPFKDNCQTG